MAQHDYVIANGSGATVRADINDALAAIASTNKGPTAPPAPTAGMIWVDDNTPSSTTWTVFMYDGTDWIALGTLNTTTNVFTLTGAALLPDGSAGAPALGFSADTNTGLWRSGTDTLQIVGNGAAILTVAPTAVTFASGAAPTWAADPTANDHLGRKVYIDAGDRWVQLSSTAITAVTTIDLTWTGGSYLAYKVLLIGARPSAATANNLFCRVRRNGSVLSGASDYSTGHTWWNGATGNATAAGESLNPLTADGFAAEASRVEIDLIQAASTERIIVDARSRYTSNTPAHSRGMFTSNVNAGSGWLDGLTISIVGGATNFAAAGRIVVLGLKS
jgi:hypothetical protein